MAFYAAGRRPRHGALLILTSGNGLAAGTVCVEREGPPICAAWRRADRRYLPVAATLATDRIYEAFLGRYEEYRHFFHGHTYTGNALGCAAALATLGLLSDGTVIRGVARKGAVLRTALTPLAAHRHVGDIRQAGLMVGIELVADRERSDIRSRRSRWISPVSLAARPWHLPAPSR